MKRGDAKYEVTDSNGEILIYDTPQAAANAVVDLVKSGHNPETISIQEVRELHFKYSATVDFL